ncbi:MAG: hypothetical protein WCZ89_03210 [Phycisphaerae bacterium]
MMINKKNGQKNQSNSILGWLAGVFLHCFKPKKKITNDELRRADYRITAQSLGVRFTERIRDVFRFRWIRKK